VISFPCLVFNLLEQQPSINTFIIYIIFIFLEVRMDWKKVLFRIFELCAKT